MRLLALVVMLAPALAEATDLTLREDPATHRHYYVDDNAEGDDVSVGWTFTDAAAKQVDFERGESDGNYLLKYIDAGRAVINVLFDVKTGRIITELGHEKAALEACWAAGDEAANHCELTVQYSAKSRLAIVVLDGKWNTRAVRLYRLRHGTDGLELQASTDLLSALVRDTSSQLARTKARDKRYQRDRKFLVYEFAAEAPKLVKETKAAFELTVDLEATGYLPKGEDDTFGFDSMPLHYRVRGKPSGKTLKVTLDQPK